MPLADYVLAVGINRYPGLNKLDGAEADAQAFFDWATQSAGAVGQTILSSQFAPAAAPILEQPASQQIWMFFETLRAAADNNNNQNLGYKAGRRLYMFFAGHGVSPSLDTSAVLMANAERSAPHHLSAKAWADRFYENGLFDEVLLFQDACRETMDNFELTPPYLKKETTSGWQKRKRFYAFAAKSPLLALEKPIGGAVRGIFSATLMAALEGAARDPMSGEITTSQLKSYLIENMASRLTDEERENIDLSQRPEVFDLDPFVIVPAPLAVQPADVFPVHITLAAPGAGAEVIDGDRQVVAQTGPGIVNWQTLLARGLYELVVPGQAGRLFKVSGALDAAGNPEIVHVS
jgi:hypothetical protein